MSIRARIEKELAEEDLTRGWYLALGGRGVQREYGGRRGGSRCVIAMERKEDYLEMIKAKVMEVLQVGDCAPSKPGGEIGKENQLDEEEESR